MRRRQKLAIISLLMMLLVLAGTLLFAYFRVARTEKTATTAQAENRDRD